MLQESNKLLIEKIKENKPFILCRIGMGPETRCIVNYIINGSVESCNFPNTGIYYNTKEQLKIFYEMNKQCFINSDFLGCFQGKYTKDQKIICETFNLKELHSRILEPFYIVLEKENPWSLELYNKKVLVINPFVNSFKSQITNNFKLFKDRDIFHPNQEFIFYKSYQTSVGNNIHSSWLETFEIMKQDIKKLDFDIALLGCGGYGLPLCNFIKTELNKSAIYIGGGLQILFGVRGKRWDNHPVIGKIMKENGGFISPSGDEILKNKEKIEGGCYW